LKDEPQQLVGLDMLCDPTLLVMVNGAVGIKKDTENVEERSHGGKGLEGEESYWGSPLVVRIL